MSLIGDDIRLGAPICRPSKIVCVGLNYAKHAHESGMEVPSEPVLFFKASSAIVGPYDEVILPKNSKKSDWEVELAIVIGAKASYVSEENAMNHVAGMCSTTTLAKRVSIGKTDNGSRERAVIPLLLGTVFSNCRRDQRSPQSPFVVKTQW